MSINHLAMGAMSSAGGGGASFPTVVSTATTVNNSQASSHALTMPASLSAGNLLLAAVRCAGGFFTGMTGWTKAGTLNSDEFVLMAKIATGSDTATATFDASGRFTANCWQIAGAATTLDLTAAGLWNWSTTAFDPAELATGSTKKRLWIAIASWRKVQVTITGAPTAPGAFGNLIVASNTTNTSVDYCNTISASLALEAATVNPGLFGTSGSDAANHRLMTIGIDPA